MKQKPCTSLENLLNVKCFKGHSSHLKKTYEIIAVSEQLRILILAATFFLPWYHINIKQYNI